MTTVLKLPLTAASVSHPSGFAGTVWTNPNAAKSKTDFGSSVSSTLDNSANPRTAILRLSDFAANISIFSQNIQVGATVYGLGRAPPTAGDSGDVHVGFARNGANPVSYWDYVNDGADSGGDRVVPVGLQGLGTITPADVNHSGFHIDLFVDACGRAGTVTWIADAVELTVQFDARTVAVTRPNYRLFQNRKWYQAAQTTKVHYLFFSDSRGLFAGEGYHDGFEFWLCRIFGCWGTGLISQQNVQGNANAGLKYNRSGFRTNDSSPPAHGIAKWGANYTNDSQYSTLSGFIWINDAGSLTNTDQGIYIGNDSPLFTGNKAVPTSLLLEVWHATHSTGTGGFTFQMRRQGAAGSYANLADGPAINTVTGSNGMTKSSHTFALSATDLANGIAGGLCRGSGSPTTIQGPYFGTFIRGQFPGITKGVSFTNMYSVGGHSARDCASCFESMTDDEMVYFWQCLLDDGVGMGVERHIMCQFIYDVNDRNETLASVLNGYTPGDSADALYDNFASLIQRMQETLVLAGGNSAWLYFTFTSGQPLGDGGADDAECLAYQQAMHFLAEDFGQCSAQSQRAIATYAEFIANTDQTGSGVENRNNWIHVAAGPTLDALHPDTGGCMAMARRLLLSAMDELELTAKTTRTESVENLGGSLGLGFE